MADELHELCICPRHGIVARYFRRPPTAPTVCPVVIDDKGTRCKAPLRDG